MVMYLNVAINVDSFKGESNKISHCQLIGQLFKLHVIVSVHACFPQ